MGVPGLFRNLTKEISLSSVREKSFPYVLFDFNCVLYEALRCLPESLVDDPSDYDVITHMVSYVSHMIRALNPTKQVFLSIDGPVPMAKLDCQRKRRYKKVIEERYKSRVHQQYGVAMTKSFDTTKLTPGTAFMDKLVSRLKVYCPLSVPCQVILSDHHVPGEGEHKLIHHMRTIPWSEPICIYGLDADLIVLMLLTRRSNIFLARDPEPDKIGRLAPGYERLALLGVDDCRLEVLTRTVGWNKDQVRVVCDFCLMSLFGGNDFVRSLPTTSVRSQGLDAMISAYIESVTDLGDYLTDDACNIRWDVVNRWIACLAQYEDMVMKTNMHKQQRGRFRTYEPPQNPRDAFSQYEHMPFVHPNHPFHAQATSRRHLIDFRKPFSAWSERYKTLLELPEERVVCRLYQESIQWCWTYYTKNVPPSWDYVYPLRGSPLANWVVHHPFENNATCPGTRMHPYSPLVQLGYVIPWSASYLLPKPLRSLKTVSSIRLDYVLADKHIYTEPILAFDDIQRYETTLSEVWNELSALEQKRNRTFRKGQILKIARA